MFLEKKMRVLHILHNSLPLISGSTIRSKYIFKYQKKFAQVFVLTSFLFNNKKDFEIIDNIPYFRINRNISKFLRLYNRILSRIDNYFYKFFKIDLKRLLREVYYFPICFFTKYHIQNIVNFYNIDIIHQHTQPKFGKYSLEVAKKLKIPYIYEVRGFIEENMLVAVKDLKRKDPKLINFIYNKIINQETDVLGKSDFIITLSEPMKEILVRRKLKEEKIGVVPNCIDTDLINPSILNSGLKEELKINEDIVIGFFGKLSWYEGIEILIKALPLILEKEVSIKILLIGNVVKEYFQYLNRLIHELNVSENVLFLKPLPHEELIKFYSIVDMIVLPRLDHAVCRVVTPIKPLEAMGFKTLVIASDLPALRCTIIDEKTGILFEPENSEALASKILYFHQKIQEKEIIENYARNYVENHFSWKKIIPKYKELYLELIRVKNS